MGSLREETFPRFNLLGFGFFMAFKGKFHPNPKPHNQNRSIQPKLQNQLKPLLCGLKHVYFKENACIYRERERQRNANQRDGSKCTPVENLLRLYYPIDCTATRNRIENRNIYKSTDESSQIKMPIGSMYGRFTCIWLIFRVNVGRYTICGFYKYERLLPLCLGNEMNVQSSNVLLLPRVFHTFRFQNPQGVFSDLQGFPEFTELEEAVHMDTASHQQG